MAKNESVSDWICQAKEGDEQAVQTLYERYFPKLLDVARQRLRFHPRTYADEEDVVQSALHKFFAAAASGQFPRLHDRQSLWRLLFQITDRKAIDLIRYHLRRTRQATDGDRSAQASQTNLGGRSIDQVADDQLESGLAAIAAEEFQRLFARLPGADLQVTALARLAGQSNKEIASQCDCSVRTVERRVKLIRSYWLRESNE
jgi:RNA polymerase sigma factor (sigma-70 family)